MTAEHTCKQCNADCRYRTVTLDLGAGHLHHFCCDSCKTTWLEHLVKDALIPALRSIHIHSRAGLPRDHAAQALKRVRA
jgi:hypothetical protein